MGIPVIKIGEIVSDTKHCLEWSAIRLPIEGEKHCGDSILLKENKRQVLIAAVDGLGHGKEAREASKKAIQTLKAFDGESLINLMNKCHIKLVKTRGVVLSTAIIDSKEDTMTWMGVGNVEGVLFRVDEDEKMETILLRGGVVGYNLPLLKAAMVPIYPGDTLIFTTDGVGYEYVDQVNINWSTKEIVKLIATKFIDRTDDASVLVVRYNGANK